MAGVVTGDTHGGNACSCVSACECYRNERGVMVLTPGPPEANLGSVRDGEEVCCGYLKRWAMARPE